MIFSAIVIRHQLRSKEFRRSNRPRNTISRRHAIKRKSAADRYAGRRACPPASSLVMSAVYLGVPVPLGAEVPAPLVPAEPDVPAPAAPAACVPDVPAPALPEVLAPLPAAAPAPA